MWHWSLFEGSKFSCKTLTICMHVFLFERLGRSLNIFRHIEHVYKVKLLKNYILRIQQRNSQK